MAKTMRAPIWTSEDIGLRILIEDTDVAKQTALTNILRDHGYSVLTCGGPVATGKQCPLVELDQCDGVADADLVVHSMRPHDPRNRLVLEKILTCHPTIPVVVEAPRPCVERQPELFEGCTVVLSPMTRETLIDAVESALRSKLETAD